MTVGAKAHAVDAQLSGRQWRAFRTWKVGKVSQCLSTRQRRALRARFVWRFSAVLIYRHWKNEFQKESSHLICTLSQSWWERRDDVNSVQSGQLWWSLQLILPSPPYCVFDSQLCGFFRRLFYLVVSRWRPRIIKIKKKESGIFPTCAKAEAEVKMYYCTMINFLRTERNFLVWLFSWDYGNWTRWLWWCDRYMAR